MEYDIPFVFDSNPENGAINITNNGSVFETVLEQPLNIPATAQRCSVRADKITIWNNNPNLFNDSTPHFSLNDPFIQVGDIEITMPSAIWSLESIEAFINDFLFASFGPNLCPRNYFAFTGNTATSKVAIQFPQQRVSTFTFNAANPEFSNLLGFDAGSSFNTFAGDILWLAPNIAALNTTNYYVVHSDLVPYGIAFNGQYNQIVDTVFINVDPWSQIQREPRNPIEIPAQDLAGTIRRSIRCWLTDDKNQYVNTRGEYWSVRLIVKFIIP